ncbi:MAG: HD domain-containing protein, partial [Gammaproteobacteria bacterium]|nr:HD domain-containing protein [Gammaproteobacteria bacterium]
MSSDTSYQHQDTLDFLNSSGPLKTKITCAHQAVSKKLPFIARIALTLYDPETKILKTYMHSSGGESPLANYQALLDNAPSLKEILLKGRPRVINNMLTFETAPQEHTQRIGRQGYAASYTLPLFNNGDFIGFLFFNSYEPDVFTESVLAELDMWGHLIALMVIKELASLNTLSAALKTTGHITHQRDPETGSHLDRMSRYSRLIARALAEKHRLDDDYIEHIFMFAPLHDIGKIAIPDHILLKPGKLTEEEMNIMKTHTSKGSEMIDGMLQNFGLDHLADVNILRNIAVCHHESLDGCGYPHGKKGNEIPLEARIVAVADVFDALTSKRSYKEAWSNSDAYAALQKMAGEQLDQDCVEALINSSDEVAEIQAHFKENA